MRHLQTRQKFFLSRLLLTAALTAAAIFVVRRSVQEHVRKEILEDLLNSTTTFQNFEREQQLTLLHSAELLANLPSLKALMTTQHEATIQDASADIWRVSGCDLLLLAGRSGQVVALHATTPWFSRSLAQKLLDDSLQQEDARHWWPEGDRLYEVVLQPVYFGSPEDDSPLGMLAVGHEIDEVAAQEISHVASGQVAFTYGTRLAVSTLSPPQKQELASQQMNWTQSAGKTQELLLGGERFLLTSIELSPGGNPPVVMSVFKSYDKAIEFLDGLTRLIIWLGLGTVLAGMAAVLLLSDTFTRPLNNLVGAVRALEEGDFDYSLQVRQGGELAEVTAAFDKMRQTLKGAQQRLLEAERLATIGRMASSISHDLRHPLTAIVANAEFMCEDNLSVKQKEEFYREVRLAVDRMNDLIESLLEFSRTRESLHLVHGSVEEVIERAVRLIRARPEFGSIGISVSKEGRGEGQFDAKKLQRAFENLLVNACEAVSPYSGRIDLRIRETHEGLEIRIQDNGPGIPESIRDRLFTPFVSFGKENGTGLGLTVAQKILQEHGGSIMLESTTPGCTVFRILLPLIASSEEIARVNFRKPVHGL